MKRFQSQIQAIKSGATKNIPRRIDSLEIDFSMDSAEDKWDPLEIPL